jgi:hypothetical protein
MAHRFLLKKQEHRRLQDAGAVRTTTLVLRNMDPDHGTGGQRHTGLAPFAKGGGEARSAQRGDLLLILFFQSQKQIPRPPLRAGLAPFFKGGENRSAGGSGMGVLSAPRHWFSKL